ncbi:acetyl-CoA carboxylase biotin carboxyl carrier protein [Eubacterium oxidoreducens]|uniref:Biotin carboxyl carrier protein of acetyl-CoA carboxylase n=1 Tax=Eubacterium oxidoreducens TaxID=1732 RepID=A0A1G6BFA0_EUBOX|nr:acetyl-CoA carboxylase biotin carboxyl carrier protein [Eubacterium oxidoreducens]SDB19249.1 acetyl-CoA carboxylase biotin carboxyl carrier protein [Eubacterium oxidoreducens]
MEFDKIVELVKVVSDSKLTEFEIEDDGFRISMGKNIADQNVVVKEMAMMPASPASTMTTQEQSSSDDHFVPEENLLKSPLVGTFYAASAPGEPPLVKVGDTVSKGQVIGIVEAMKLMNEIESEKDGVVKAILVKNEEVVEYDQPLFVIE